MSQRGETRSKVKDTTDPPRRLTLLLPYATVTSSLSCHGQHSMSRSSSGLGHRPFTAATRVRLPYGTPNFSITYEILPFRRESRKGPLTKSMPSEHAQKPRILWKVTAVPRRGLGSPKSFDGDPLRSVTQRSFPEPASTRLKPEAGASRVPTSRDVGGALDCLSQNIQSRVAPR